MDIAKKWLYGSATLVVTMLIIGVGFTIFSKTKLFSDGVIQGQDRELQLEQEYDIVKYDGYKINGSVALNYLKTMVTEHDLSVVIEKGSTKITITSSSDFASLRDINHDSYLNPMKEYLCTVERDENDAISKIIIKEMS